MNETRFCHNKEYDDHYSPTPTSTKTEPKSGVLPSPFNRRRSHHNARKLVYGEGRSIPVKQGFLYKKSSGSLGREWREKYVVLCESGNLMYYPNLASYLQDIHRKEIPLNCVTVKVPGQKPTGLKSLPVKDEGEADHCCQSSFVRSSSSTTDIHCLCTI